MHSTQIRHNIAHAKPLLDQCMTGACRATELSQLIASQRKPTQVSYKSKAKKQPPNVVSKSSVRKGVWDGL